MTSICGKMFLEGEARMAIVIYVHLKKWEIVIERLTLID